MHIPFCSHKCDYCDFFSQVDLNENHQQLFTKRLLQELTAWQEVITIRPHTIFIGGGTPTILKPRLWHNILQTLNEYGIMSKVREFTIEANPETVTEDLMATLARGGVNRISMGAQSFNPALLKQLARIHNPDNVSRAMQIVRNAGITDINLDMIFAIPTQQIENLQADIDQLLNHQPTHISYYGLTYEPGTKLHTRLATGNIQPASEETERDMYIRVRDQLQQAGYEQYEISNWAKSTPAKVEQTGDSGMQTGATGPDTSGSASAPNNAWWLGQSETPPQNQPPVTFCCQHNLAYWQNRNWLGIGPSAASHIDGTRWRNADHLQHYLQGGELQITDIENLDNDRRIGERLMLGLRLTDGIALNTLKQIMPQTDPRWTRIEELKAMGMLRESDRHLQLTEDGVLVANSVIEKLL